MRLPALLLLLLAPLAAAQSAPVELATLEAEPFPELVRPLQGPVSTTLRARVSCALTDGAQGVPILYAVKGAPDWVTTTITPAQDVLPTAACDQGWLQATATLTVTATDQAPAFVPTPIALELTAGPAGREQRASATVDVSATYFAILDVQLEESIATIPPGGAVDFVVRLTNFGNGDTRVEPVLVDAGEGLEVSVAAPVTLESRQNGGLRISDDMTFRVSAPPADGYVNRVGMVNIRLLSAYAADDSFAGDASSVSFLVTVRTDAPDLRPSELPLPAALPLVALLAALLVRRALRP